jgi:hypothetical protein
MKLICHSRLSATRTIDEECHASIKRLSRILQIRKPISLMSRIHEHAQYGWHADLLMADGRRYLRGKCRAENENKLRFERRRDSAGQFHRIDDQLLEAAYVILSLALASGCNRQHNAPHASITPKGMPPATPDLNKPGTPWEWSFQSSVQPGSLGGGAPYSPPFLCPPAFRKGYCARPAAVCKR